MGFRLYIEETKDICCGGKLYGYISDEELEDCKSLKWLISKGYVDEEDKDMWGMGFEQEIILHGYELKEFIKLYLRDYEKYGYNCEDTKEELKSAMKNCKEYSHYVLNWF